MNAPAPASPAESSRPRRSNSGTRRIGWLVVAAVAIIAAVMAATASRPPATEAERAYELKEATLCPVCDGQSVLESNAPAAAAMRRQIDLWVDAGRSDTEIRAELVAAYGEDVNALPPGEGVGTLVWALPVVAFAAASAGLWAATRRWKARSAAEAALGEDAATAAGSADGPDEVAVGAGVGQESVGARLGGSRDEPSTDDGGAAPHDAPGLMRANRRSNRVRRASVATVGALVLIGAVAGVLVARSAGLRLSGETLSGDIDRSARSLLVDAQRQFAANRLDESRATLEEVFRLERDLRGALVLSARLHLRRCETLSSASSPDASAGSADDSGNGGQASQAVGTDPAGAAGAEDSCDLQSALIDLDRVLAQNPSDTEALALRGWLLVRIPDPELIAAGIASLDAAVALDPGEFDPWVFRGYTARFIERDLAAAIGYYRAALERSPPPAMAAALENAIAEMQAAAE